MASLIPDIDGLSLLFGLEAYEHFHHLLLHNLAIGAAVTLISVYWIGLRPVSLALVFTAFLSHLIGDYFGSGPGWGLWPFLPFSDRFYLCEWAWNLVSWQNTLITLVAIAVALWTAVQQGHTPLEFAHAGVERTVVDALQLRRVAVSCHWCSVRATARCQRCHHPACPTHVASHRNFRLLCRDCCAPSNPRGDHSTALERGS